MPVLLMLLTAAVCISVHLAAAESRYVYGDEFGSFTVQTPRPTPWHDPISELSDIYDSSVYKGSRFLRFDYDLAAIDTSTSPHLAEACFGWAWVLPSFRPDLRRFESLQFAYRFANPDHVFFVGICWVDTDRKTISATVPPETTFAQGFEKVYFTPAPGPGWRLVNVPLSVFGEKLFLKCIMQVDFRIVYRDTTTTGPVSLGNLDVDEVKFVTPALETIQDSLNLQALCDSNGIPMSNVRLAWRYVDGTRRLRSVYLDSLNIHILPECLTALSCLETLSISGNGISTIPDSISRLSNLRYLNASSNRLLTLPNSISQLPQLGYLDVSANEISDMDSSIIRMLPEIRVINSYPDPNAECEIWSYLDCQGVPCTKTCFSFDREYVHDTTYVRSIVDFGKNHLCDLDQQISTWLEQADPDWQATQNCQPTSVGRQPIAFTFSILAVAKGGAVLQFTLPEASNVSIRLFTAQGKLARSISFPSQIRGHHSINLPMQALSKGFFLLDFKAGTLRHLGKIANFQE